MERITKGSRNSAIELYRVVLMVGIILLHITGFREFWGHWKHLAFLLLPCVDGFVLITGYFGTKFSLRKLCYLYATALWCVSLVVLLYHLLTVDFHIMILAKDMLKIFRECWFLHAYAFLLCFAPLINHVFDSCDKHEQIRLFLPVCMVIFGWGLFLGLKGVHHFTPDMPGLTAKSGLTLVGVYIVGRLYRMNQEYFDQIPLWGWGIGLLCLGVICTLGLGWFGNYNSPFAVAFALSFLHLFKKIKCPSLLGKGVSWLSASVFSIYIFHANELSYVGIKFLIKHFQGYGMPLICCFILTVLVIYTISVLFDFPRRILFRLILK